MLQLHGEANLAVAESGLHAIANLAECDAAGALIELLDAAGAPSVVVTMLRLHGSSPEVVESGVRFIRRASKRKATAKKMAEEGACEGGMTN